jgi:hypothetical protein
MKWNVRGVGVILGVSAVLVGGACARETAPRVEVVDHDLQGSWGQNAGALPPGNEFIMALTESAGTVTGTGTFAGEAGPFGALAVSGTVARDTVHLQVIYNFDPQFSGLHPDTAQFSGVLFAQDTIAGALVRGGTADSVRYVRLRIDDPPA